MFDFKSFYSYYQYDYHLYKVLMLKSILDKGEDFQKDLLNGYINDYLKTDFERTLRSEIRQCVFHVIETLFELIFALPVKNDNKVADHEILINLAKSNGKKNYDKIEKIAENIENLEFLNKELLINGETISLARYIFYFGILPSSLLIKNEILVGIEPSLSAINSFLHIIATEFSNRLEYNNYKHALRNMPIYNYFQISIPEKKINLNVDLKNSMTFIHLNKNEVNKELNIDIVTKSFDTERDTNLVLLCSQLISNIILLRRIAFKLPSPTNSIEVYLFFEEIIAVMSKRNVGANSFKFSMISD